MVYVLNIDGQPLMPTNRHGKVRRMLNSGQAKVVKRCPFVIQLLYETENHIQPISLGVDAGSKHIGLSATTTKKELYSADIEVRNDIVKLLSTRRQLRRARRNRLRYRPARFDNRVKSKHKGWLAPSVEQKINTHIQVINNVLKILPVTKIIVEGAEFDIQKIKNPEISGAEYQQGEQYQQSNVRAYVLSRDNYTCQCCKGKSGDKHLEVHHIESRKTGGNAPNNLITLCETCHDKYTLGKIELPKNIKRGKEFNDAAFMNIMRSYLFEKLRKLYPNIEIKQTYGYITRVDRLNANLPKEHYIDARCVSGNPKAEPLDCVYYQRKVRCHNRKIHKENYIKGGRKKTNHGPYEVFGFRRFDKVEYQNKVFYINSLRQRGFFQIKDLQGNTVNKGSVSYKKLKLLEKSKHFITERRGVARNRKQFLRG